MKTKFPYSSVNWEAAMAQYLAREDAIKTYPSDKEMEQEAVKAIVKDHIEMKTLPEGSHAQCGDTLTLKTESTLPRFNKPRVVVTLGRGLYNAKLEAALVGKAVGETCTVEVDGEQVKASVLVLRRKSVPAPTDEMAAALKQKDFQDNTVETVDGYVAYIKEAKRLELLGTASYYVMEQLLKEYPVTDFDSDDITVLGQLEREAFGKMFLEKNGIDVNTASREEMQELLHVDTMDEFIEMRRDWYKMKIHQCWILLTILGLPCEGRTDPLDHYEVLSELTERFYDKLMQYYKERT